MHVLNALVQELQSLNVEEKQAVDDITDRIVDIDKVLALLQITADSKCTNPDNK